MMQQNNPQAMHLIIWISFLSTIAVFFFILTNQTGGFGQYAQLDHNRMLDFTNEFAITCYVIGALMYVGHSIVPKLVRSPERSPVGLIVKLAMLESMALFGFVLAKNLQDGQAAIPFFALAAVGMIRACPLFKMERPQRPGTPIT